ncbi:hypothetical protein G9A89_015227 [Geosiphon pyriformis]|nr:hypothetical protein G9A89_015227 [Geosiphon pyriformis]
MQLMVTAQDQICLANIYKKKQSLIACPVSFGSKTWAQVVGGSSLYVVLLFFSGTKLSFGTGISFAILAPPGNSDLHDCLVSLKHSVELLSDQVSGILKKLSFVELMSLALLLFIAFFVASASLKLGLNLDMAVDNVLMPSVSPFTGVSVDMSGFSFSSSKVLTTKVGGLESKIVALDVLVNSVLGVAKTINFLFISLNLVNAIIDYDVFNVGEFFDTNYQTVFMLMDANNVKWTKFKEDMTVNAAMFHNKFFVFGKHSDLDAIYDSVFTKKLLRFHKLELLVSKIIKASYLVFSKKFVSLFIKWHSLDAVNASVVKFLFLLGFYFNTICSTLVKVRKSYHSSKMSKLKHVYTIRSVLECLFCKITLNHLVVNNKLVLDSDLVKAKMDHVMVTDISDDWCHQYQPLKYVFDNTFSNVMCLIGFDKMHSVILNLPNEKVVVLEESLGVNNFQTIFLVCSVFDVLRKNNISVLKGTMTQSLIFNMWKTYDFVRWEHLSKSLVKIKMCDKSFDFLAVFTTMHNDLNQGEIFSPLLWHIFYDSLLCKVKRQESVSGLISLLAADAFVDNTIWVGSNQIATQHILNITNEFFQFNDISINNDKTVTIPVNCRVACLFLLISGLPIFIAKKGESYWYLGIFLFTEGLSKLSLAKTHVDVHFFANFVLKKTISNKQFLYLVLVVFFLIVSYRSQFSFVPVNVYNKWDTLIHKSLKFKSGFLHDFSNNAFYYLLLYNLKTFKQIYAESKSTSINGTLLSFVFGGLKFFKYVSSLWQYEIAFAKQLCNCAGIVFDWKMFKWWKKLDPHGLIPNWFKLSVHFLNGASSSFICLPILGSVDSLDILEFYEFGIICDHLLGVDAGHFSVYMDGSLSSLGTPDIKASMTVFFENIGLGLSVEVSGLVSSTMAKLQVVVLALECILSSSLVHIFSNSQSALDACKLELDLLFEHHHIMGVICKKNLVVSWHKVKDYLGVLDNEHANAFAKAACFSNWYFSYYIANCYIKTGSDIFFVMYFGLSIKYAGRLALSFLVWYSNLHLASGFTNRSIAEAYTNFMKALYYWLSVVVYKCLYAKNYPNVICLFCEDIEISNHTFFCLFNSDVCCLSFCSSNAAVCVALSKRFVFNDWYQKSLFIFKDSKIVGRMVVNFMRRFGLVFREKIWLAHVKHWAFMEKNGLISYDESVPVSVFELFSVFSVGIVKLLGIADIISISFGFCNFCQFFSGLDSVVLVYIDT